MPSNFNKKGFGKDLGAILGAVERTDDFSPRDQSLKYVMVHQLSPGKYQPRRSFDQSGLQELSDSIRSQGLLQPIVARYIEGNEYEIIAGERRWRAAQMAGLQQVPIVICNISNESALAFGLIENIQREDLNPIEEALALQRLVEEFSMTHEQVASSIGRPRASVSNSLRLLNLSEQVKTLLVDKKLEVGHAKVLLPLSSEKQVEIAQLIYNKKMTVREAEKLIKSKKSRAESQSKRVMLHENCADWECRLSSSLATKVAFKVDREGKGKIEICVSSVEEIDWLINKLL